MQEMALMMESVSPQVCTLNDLSLLLVMRVSIQINARIARLIQSLFLQEGYTLEHLQGLLTDMIANEQRIGFGFADGCDSHFQSARKKGSCQPDEVSYLYNLISARRLSALYSFCPVLCEMGRSISSFQESDDEPYTSRLYVCVLIHMNFDKTLLRCSCWFYHCFQCCYIISSPQKKEENSEQKCWFF